MRRMFLMFMIIGAACPAVSAQSRKSVGAAEVTGTFRYYFGGRFKGSSNDIRILALGRNELKVEMDLIYPFADGTGNLSANVGEARGVADIRGDTATFAPEDTTGCTITLKFVRPDVVRVTQTEQNSGCGFGLNVTAEGTYKKVSGAKPKFGQ